MAGDRPERDFDEVPEADDELKSVTEEDELGSLAQKAREKQLKTARGILIFIGILTIAVNAFFLSRVREDVKEAINKEVRKLNQRGMQADPAAVRDLEENAVKVARAIHIGTIVLGAVFVGLALVIKVVPVVSTVVALVLYLGAAIIFAVLDPTSIVRGIIIKIIIIVLLFKAVQAAIAYDRERKQAAMQQSGI